eukprot:m51a1_g13865 hypothetical protein (450) ;mRNA; r:609047-610396
MTSAQSLVGDAFAAVTKDPRSSVASLAAWARGAGFAPRDSSADDESVAESLYAPLSASYALRTLAPHAVARAAAGDRPLRLLVCGCRGLDGPGALWGSMSRLLGVPSASVVLCGVELDDRAASDPCVSTARCTLEEMLARPGEPFDAVVAFQPGLQLHRSWHEGMHAALRSGAALLCSSLDARECRNDRLVCALHGLVASAPVDNPFGPKNATCEAMARDPSRWSGLLWTVRRADGPAASGARLSALERMTEAVLGDHAHSVWNGYWDFYDLGCKVSLGCPARGYIALGDDLYVLLGGLDGKAAFFFCNRHVPEPKPVCGLYIAPADFALLPSEGDELSKAFWCYCVRQTYVVPLYNELLGGYMSGFDSAEEAAGFSLTQGAEITRELIESAVLLDCRRALPGMDPNAVRSVAIDGGQIEIELQGGVRVAGPRAPFHLLAEATAENKAL